MMLNRKFFVIFMLALGAACGGDDADRTPATGSDSGAPIGMTGNIDAGGPTGTSGNLDAGQGADAAGQVVGASDGAISVIPVQGMDAGSSSTPGTYVLSIIIFGPDNNSTSTYVTVVDSLDVKSVDTKQALEFGGQANIATYNGKVFISDGEAPVIARYQLSADKKLEKEAEISFAQFGVDSVSVDDTLNTFISPTKAYILGGDGTTVVWNPSDMTIVKPIPVQDPIVDMGADLTLSPSSGFARGNRLYRTFSWINWTTYAYADQQYLAVYDTDADTLLSVTAESRCPALGALVTADEGGTAYFSNWFYNVAGTLQNGKPPSCALRIKPGSDTFDPDWKLDFSAITGGHEGAQLSYTTGGQALFAAFHQEAFSITPDTSPYDLISSTNWEVWTVDLNSKQAKAVAGIDRLGAQQTVFTLDGRTFLFAPNQDFSTTKVYEVKPDGTSAPAFDIQGWSRAFLKIK